MELNNGFESVDLEDAIVKAHKRLSPGGPRVDWEKLCLYVDGVLAPEDAEVVQGYVLSWDEWHRAWLQLIACGEDALDDESAVQQFLNVDLDHPDVDLSHHDSSTEVAKPNTGDHATVKRFWNSKVFVPPWAIAASLLAVASIAALLLWQTQTNRIAHEKLESSKIRAEFLSSLAQKQPIAGSIADADQAIQNHLRKFPQDSDLALQYVVALVIRSDKLTPELKQIVSNWQSHIDEAVDPFPAIWNQKLSELSFDNGEAESGLNYGLKAQRAMSDSDPRYWNIESTRELALQLRRFRRFEDIVEITNPFWNNKESWIDKKGTSNCLLIRVTALAALEKNYGDVIKFLAAPETLSKLLDEDKVVALLSSASYYSDNKQDDKFDGAFAAAREASTRLYGETRQETEIFLDTSLAKHAFKKRDAELLVKATGRVGDFLSNYQGSETGVTYNLVSLAVMRMSALVAEKRLGDAVAVDEKITLFLDRVGENYRSLAVDVGRTKLYIALGKTSEAFEIVERAIKRVPENGDKLQRRQLAEIYYYKGCVEGMTRKFEEGEQSFAKAIGLTSSEEFGNECRINQGICQMNIPGKKDQGKELVASVLAKIPLDSRSELRELVDAGSFVMKVGMSLRTSNYLVSEY